MTSSEGSGDRPIRKHGSKKCHHGKDLDLVCVSCKLLVYGTCVINDHKGHEFADVDSVIPQAKERLQRYVDHVEKDLIPRIDSDLQEVDTDLSMVKEHHQQHIQDIREKMKIIQTELLSIADLMVKTCQGMEITSCKDLVDYKEKLNDMRRTLSLQLQKCKKILQSKNDVLIHDTSVNMPSLMTDIPKPASEIAVFNQGRCSIRGLEDMIGELRMSTVIWDALEETGRKRRHSKVPKIVKGFFKPVLDKSQKLSYEEPREKLCHEPKFQAVNDFKADDSNQISLKKEDIITGVSLVDKTWMEGTLHGRGKSGMFPCSLVKRIPATVIPESQKRKQSSSENDIGEASSYDEIIDGQEDDYDDIDMKEKPNTVKVIKPEKDDNKRSSAAAENEDRKTQEDARMALKNVINPEKKNAAEKQNKEKKAPPVPVKKFMKTKKTEVHRCSVFADKEDERTQNRPKPTIKYQALYDFNSKRSDQASFIEGDIIDDVLVHKNDWIEGTVRRTGQYGLVLPTLAQQIFTDNEPSEEENDKCSKDKTTPDKHTPEDSDTTVIPEDQAIIIKTEVDNGGTVKPNKQPPADPDTTVQVQARCNYFAEYEGAISFVEGDIIDNVENIGNNDWIKGMIVRTGKSGYIPIDFIDGYVPQSIPIKEDMCDKEEVIPIAQQTYEEPVPSKFKAKRSFDAKEENEVSFEKGDVILVDEDKGDWIEGKVQRTGKCGMVPKIFVEEI